MKYNFDKVIDRFNKDALAVDGLGKNIRDLPNPPSNGYDVISMWIADMNFETFPNITKTIKERLEHPLFGYYLVRDEFYDSIIYWQNRRNSIDNLKKENILYQNGVLGGLASSLRALIKKGDKILLNSPTYIGFTKTILNAGYDIVLSDFIFDGEKWIMDYQDMDKKIKENNIKVVIMCNPHNPTGRCFTREELVSAVKVFENNNCIIISDEIWSDIIFKNHKHIPIHSVSEYAKNNSICLYSLCKTFNLAGIVGGYSIIYNKNLYELIEKESEATGYNNMNVLTMYSFIGAYTEEANIWVDELNEVLEYNSNYAYNFFKKIDGISLSKPEGTYMLYIDISLYLKRTNKTFDEVLNKGFEYGVIWQDGRPFHKDNSIRINLASPKERIKEALERLKEFVLN